MHRPARTIAPWPSRTAPHLVAWLIALFSITACSRNQSIQRADVPSAEEAWVNAACSPATPDFSGWTRHRVEGVTIAAPPSFIVEQGSPTSLAVRSPSRSTYGALSFVFQKEARETFDSYFFRQQRMRNLCRATMSGYPADVFASYDRGRFALVARWQAEWGGEDAGKWMLATISSTRLEEATELRAILHTMRPASNGR